MHHYRGRLFQGEMPRLDPANVYVDFGPPGDGGSPDWSGYLVVKSEHDVAAGATYTLKLEDGRSGSLQVKSVGPDDPDRFRAEFVGLGPMQ
ncbi:MAG: hypothetical protein U0790_25760 [Isosphaeraceae bacterium]